jgi:endonuclease/exonuclease/phosphatase family metal-dependent hydrolase
MIPSTEHQTQKLRVLTLNVFGHFADWPARRSILIRGLADLAPDLIAFQELIVTKDYDQGAELLGPEYQLVHAKQRGPDASGITIASRWPVSDICELVLHITARDDDFPCTTLIGEVLVPGPFGPLVFVNHCPEYHPNQEYERELQIVSAARSIEKMIAERGRPVVLAGDFNADTETASIRFLMGKQSLQAASVCYANAWDKIHKRESGATFTR